MFHVIKAWFLFLFLCYKGLVSACICYVSCYKGLVSVSVSLCLFLFCVKAWFMSLSVCVCFVLYWLGLSVSFWVFVIKAQFLSVKCFKGSLSAGLASVSVSVLFCVIKAWLLPLCFCFVL